MTQAPNVPKDQYERNIISTEFNKNIFVEAGAGAGKTTELINRIINQLLNTEITTDQIVVITFTKKAANELTERFIKSLRETIEEEEQSQTRINNKLQQAYENRDKIFIGTIHSFCAKLLKEQPFYSGLGFSFTEIDEEEERRHLSKLWLDFVTDDNNSGQVSDLRKLGIDPFQLQETFLACYNNRDVERVLPQLDKPVTMADLPQITSSINEIIEQIVKLLSILDGYIKAPFKKWLEEAGKVLDNSGNNNNFRNIKGIMSGWLKEIGVKITTAQGIKSSELFNKRKKMPDNCEETINKLVELHNKLCSEYDRIQDSIYIECMNLIEAAMDAYDEYKRANNLCSFSDMLIKTRDMLRENPEVREHFKARYKSYYVDEFQDTDPIQAEILFYLTGNNRGSGINWMEFKPEPGSLFVVGDPKQAIYRFRRADISVYKSVKKLISDHGGSILELTTNFRSKPSLCESFNKAFKNGFFADKEDDVYQANYCEMCSNSANDNVNRVFKYVVEYSKKDDIISDDVDNVVAIVKKLLDSKKVQPEDIMVITPLAQGNHVYYDAMTREGIPVIHTGNINIDNHINRNVIRILKVIQNPNDAISLTAVIHNVFNINLDDIHKYIENGGKLSIFYKQTDELAATPVGQALNKLKYYYGLHRKINDPVSLTDYISEDLGIKSGARLMPDAGKSYKNLNQLLESQKDISSTKAENDLSRYIERLEAVLMKTYKNQVPASPDEKGVRLMNLHQAKGLQAKVVILASPYKSDKEKPVSMHIERLWEECGQKGSPVPKGYFRFISKNRFGHSQFFVQIPDWDNKFNEEEKYLEEEEKRLLYVAATRAEELLIIADYDKEHNKGYWYRLIEKFNCPELDDSWVNAIEEPKKGNQESGDSKDSTDSDNPVVEVMDLSEKLSFDEFEDSWRKNIDAPSYTSILPSRLEKERVKRPEDDEISITFIQEDKPEDEGEENLSVELPDKIADEFGYDAGQPYGPIWGTCIHRVFELIVNEFIKNNKVFPDKSEIENIIKTAVSEILLNEDVTSKNFRLFYNGSLKNSQDIKGCTDTIFIQISPYILNQVDLYLQSYVADTLKRAEKIMPEMAFWLKVDPEDDESYGDGLYAHLQQYLKSAEVRDGKQRPIIVSGVMDLVIKADNEWSIVDYKTNKPRRGKTMDEILVSKYSSQLKAYKMIFERLTNEKVTEMCLYSTVTGEVIMVE